MNDINMKYLSISIFFYIKNSRCKQIKIKNKMRKDERPC